MRAVHAISGQTDEHYKVKYIETVEKLSAAERLARSEHDARLAMADRLIAAIDKIERCEEIITRQSPIVVGTDYRQVFREVFERERHERGATIEGAKRSAETVIEAMRGLAG